MSKIGSGKFSRRNFLSTASASAFAFNIIKPELVFGTTANSKINLGVIGCGARATQILKQFKDHGGYNIVAAADYFKDRVDKFSEKYNVPANRRYTTLSGYKELLDSGVDAVAIESPAYFHPIQAAAAIKAGVNVYLAKPVAVDVAGCKTIEQTAEEATRKKLCLLVDLQTRAHPIYVDAIKRVHSGGIGDMVFGESIYHACRLPIQAKPGNPEARLKNWLFDKALSGDIITEQNIHTLDVMSWIMNTNPLHVTGTGGRKVRTDVGDCWDYYTLVFEYPNNVGITFSSRQFAGHGTEPNGIINRMFGTKGVLEARYGGRVRVLADRDNYYKGGKTSQIYLTGVQNNVDSFYKNIVNKNYANETVAPSVQSNLVSILGRTAAYQNRRVTWDEIVRSNQKFDGKLDGLKS